MAESQSAAAVMMIRPVRFGVNQLTAATNEFQQSTDQEPTDELQRRASEEFEALVALLSDSGVRVYVFDDTPEPHTPDSVFPNNWISFHADGTSVLYPMLAENRRLERRPELIDALAAEHGFQPAEVIDLSPHERAGRFLEGTGSLVLDRVHRIAYAGLSPRTDPAVVQEFASRCGYEVCSFEAVGPSGQPIYHANVLLAVGARSAVLCAESIPDLRQRSDLISSLQRTGHEVVQISPDQMMQFAGNMLELRSVDGESLLVMSRRAEQSLSAEQHQALSRSARLISAPVDTIEDCSGGSVRCMLAEIHLPHPELD
jgi:hypothetical protein